MMYTGEYYVVMINSVPIQQRELFRTDNFIPLEFRV